MAKYFSDGRTPVGTIYQVDNDERFYYDCEFCSTSFSGSDEYKLEQKVDKHEREHYSEETES